MSVIDKIKEETSTALENVMGEEKVYTHAVFCQCVLPVRRLPAHVGYYEVKHGNASLMVQSGMLWDERGKAVKMEVPSGAKSRLLLPYIINQAIRSDNPQVDMGENLYSFMRDNNIKIGGANRKELQKQVNNIAASSINLGVWGENETHRFGSQRSYRIASEVSFWTEKDASQLTFWNPTLTISDEFMATLSNHQVMLDMRPLIELQANPRAMDMYMWLSYRIRTVKRPIKISFEDLHGIFGMQTAELKNFKVDFKRAVRMALDYVPDADVDLDSDPRHIILKNSKHKLFTTGVYQDSPMANVPVEGGVFGELEAIGIAKSRIKQLAEKALPQDIKKALDITKQSMTEGKVKNPAGFFTKALKEGWEPAKKTEEAEPAKVVEIDQAFEETIQNQDWKEVRDLFQKQHGAATFNAWIKDVQFSEAGEGRVLLKAKTRFIADYIDKHYRNDLQKHWSTVNAAVREVKISF